MASEKQRKRRARYGDGCLALRGEIWYAKWRVVERLPDGTNRYRQHSQSTGSTDKDFARRFLRSRLQEAGGHRPRVVDPRKVSYEDLRDGYLAYAVAQGRRSLYRTSDGKTTVPTFTRLNRFFGGWKAVEITVADLRRFQGEARRELSEAGTNRCMATLRAMFNLAVKDERLTRTEIPAHFPMFKEPNKARGAYFIKAEWYVPLRRRLKGPLRSMFTLAYHTGIRVHEMRRLRWSAVDLDKRIINLPGEITKTGEPRSLPLPADFDLKSARGDGLVFPLGDIRYAWYKACVAIGAGNWACRACGVACQGTACPKHGEQKLRHLKYFGPLLRHCRHTAVRNMSDTGAPETRIMAITGHTTRAMFDRYNIGRERDVEIMRQLVEKQHREQQEKARRERKLRVVG